MLRYNAASQKIREDTMKRLVLFLALLLFPLTVIAGEKVSGTSFYVVNQQGWETGDGTGYWIWHAEGVQHSAIGPLGTSPTECHGAGFWNKDGSWGEGVCVVGTGDDTRTLHWKRDKGEKVGHWKDLTGTGKYAGMVGEGTYSSTQLPGERHVTEWEGEVTLAQ
jgi:hypothetical protein